MTQRKNSSKTGLGAAILIGWAILGCQPPSGSRPDAGPEGPASSSAARSGRAASASSPDPQGDAALTFRKHGEMVATMPLAQLLEKVPEEEIEAFDPYYKTAKRWRAVPLAAVVRAGLSAVADPLESEEFLLRARDGYTVPLSGAQIFEAGGYIAFADRDHPGWEPIGPQRADPAPFYVVWTGPAQQSAETHPRPWQLSVIEIARFEDVFPHVVPKGEPEGAPAWQGLTLFRKNCILCHAINREGGRVGPDLNVPQSVVEYRPSDQIRAFIKNPLSFRYSAMPAHPFLTERDLDALVAYFESMKERKHDPDADAGAH